MEDTIIRNGIEIKVTDKEYLQYLKENHKPINEMTIELFGGE